MMALPQAIQPLTSAPAWVCWKWVTKKNGDRDKPPVRSDFPDFPASTSDPKTWGTFTAAARTVENGSADGVGYMLSGDAERVFLDMDGCRNPKTGEIADWAMRYVEEADSYTEITPSLTGLRIIGLAGPLTNPIHTAYRLPGGGQGEVYFRAVRYVTVTGNRLPGTPDKLRDISDLTLDLLAAAGRERAARAQPTSSGEPQAAAEDIAAALAVIPNDNLPWDDWVRVGMAAYRASGGSEEGFAAWQAWSAKSEKFDPEDCRGRWCHFHKSPPTRIGFGSLYHMATEADAFWQPPSWTARREQGGTEQDGQQARDSVAPLPLIYWADVEPNTDVNDFVEGLLTEAAMSVVYGESNAGKTFFVTDLAAHVATGRPWRGREIEPGGVIYCALEGSHGIGNRVAAFKRAHGLEGVEVPFAIVPVSINLLDPDADRAKLVATIRVASEAMGVTVKLIVIDTLSRALAGGNENAPDDMGALVASADYIRQAVKGHVCFIHHSGKDAARGARGHSLLRAATDTEIEIARAEGSDVATVRVTKQRDMEKADDMAFRLEKVTLGTNRRGKDVTSCVVRDANADDVKPAAPKLNRDGKDALNALREALAKPGAGTRGDGRDIPNSVSTLPLAVWRAEFMARSGLDDPAAKRQAWKRGWQSAKDAGLVAILNDVAWIVEV